MTRSKLSLKNLARLILSLFLIPCLILGCSSSTAPTYLKEDTDDAIRDICKKEYKIDVKTALVGQTLWVYLPVEDMLTKSEKPEKYIDRFDIEENKAYFEDGTFKLEYKIKNIPDQEKIQEYTYNKSVLKKMNNVWRVVRRVLFSTERSKRGSPEFFCLVTADIKNGFEIKEILYAMDLKKVAYEFISWREYYHRSSEETNISEAIIGDKEGKHLIYKDITMEEFLAAQIRHRIKLKFQKPEVDKNADIDKEVIKAVVYTLKTYRFKDFKEAVFNNLSTDKKSIFNGAAVLSRPIE